MPAGFGTEFAMVGRVAATTAALTMTTLRAAGDDAEFRTYCNASGANLLAETPVAAAADATGHPKRLIASLSGLTENTRYYYAIETRYPAGSGDWATIDSGGSPIVGEFHTSPGSFARIAVWTDPHVKQQCDPADPDYLSPDSIAGRRSLRYRHVLQLVGDGRYHAAVSLGDEDHIPGNRLTSLIAIYDWNMHWRNFVRPALDRTPFYLVGGNHRSESGVHQLYAAGNYQQRWQTVARKRYLANPADGEAGPDSTWIGDDPGHDEWAAAVDTADGNTAPLENYYSVRIGPVELFALDVLRYTGIWDGITDPSERTLGGHDADPENWTGQWAKLRDTVDASTAPWKIACAHHLDGGVNDYGRGGGGAVKLAGREHLVLHNYLVGEGFVGFFYGHDHLVHHALIDGLHYCECGSPSALLGVDQEAYLYNVPESTYTASQYGYVHLEATDEAVVCQWRQTMANSDNDPADNWRTLFAAGDRPRGDRGLGMGL